MILGPHYSEDRVVCLSNQVLPMRDHSLRSGNRLDKLVFCFPEDGASCLRKFDVTCAAKRNGETAILTIDGEVEAVSRRFALSSR